MFSNNNNTDNNTDKQNKDTVNGTCNTAKQEICICSFTCCEFNKLYQMCNSKLKASIDEIIKLKAKIEDLYSNRGIFEHKTQQNIIVQCANALLIISNILTNILQNNQITDIVDIKESAMFNACSIALKQVMSVFLKLNIYAVEPSIGDIYDPSLHNAVSIVNKANLDNNTIAYIVEPGAYYKKGNAELILIKPAIVIINIYQ